MSMLPQVFTQVGAMLSIIPTMNNNLIIATWNLCLGIANKKDIVTKYLSEHNIKVCCLQETEVPKNYPVHVLNCNNYVLEFEESMQKAVLVYT